VEAASGSKVKFTLNERQKRMMPLVMIGAFFEGFDFMVINLALPFITSDFNLNDQTASFTVSAVAVGTLLAFFVVRLADRWGRRPIFLWSVIIYSFLSLVTAFSPNVEFFIVCQFLARVFLVTCWAVGFIFMTEEFAPEMRGRAVGLFQSAAAVGAIFPSLLLPVTAMFNMEWEGLYIIGALPLILVIFFAKNLPETTAFMRVFPLKND
jgi:MFS family permease